VILLGGFFVKIWGQPLLALFALIALKIAIDLGAHEREHEDLRLPMIPA